MNIVDKIIKEPIGGAHRDKLKTFELVKANIIKSFSELSSFSKEKLIAKRMEKYSKMGIYQN
jgi:acetyl-CoA carboxylase carboxyl transferase subunit alpha